MIKKSQILKLVLPKETEEPVEYIFTLAIAMLGNYISSSTGKLENGARRKDCKQSYGVWAKEFSTFFLLIEISVFFKNIWRGEDVRIFFSK